MTESGVTVFGPFAADTDYFAADKAFMLNFRVADLDAMIAQLESADIEISHESEMEGIGRFARIHDPEGNGIELGSRWDEVRACADGRDQGGGLPDERAGLEGDTGRDRMSTGRKVHPR